MNFPQIADILMKASPADETEVFATEQDESLTRFANNFVHQNVTERNISITVRSVIGTKVGIAISNDTRPESLQSLVRRAQEVARLQPENPEFKGLPEPQRVRSVESFHDGVAWYTPEQRAAIAGVICAKATAEKYTAAGSVTTAVYHLGVANSKGVRNEHRSTLMDASTVIMGNNCSGWAQSSGWRTDAVDAESLANEALSKVRTGADPIDYDPGEYAVILDPYATADILDMLAYDGMSAQAVQEGRSWMNGRLGERIMAENVTIIDDGTSTAGIPLPFDFEGVPKQTVSIVENGIARSPVYDKYTADREPGKQSTGHATPPSPHGRFGPMPMNLFLRPGTSSLDAMIRSTKLGLYITRFWYTRTVHPREAVITGMTRDGTFLVRDGEIVHAIKSLRFTQSYLEALKYTEAIGATSRVLRSGMGGATSVPPVKLFKFRFTSSTR